MSVPVSKIYNIGTETLRNLDVQFIHKRKSLCSEIFVQAFFHVLFKYYYCIDFKRMTSKINNDDDKVSSLFNVTLFAVLSL